MGAPFESPMGSGHRSQRARRWGVLSTARMGPVLALPWLHTTAPYDQRWHRTEGREEAGGAGQSWAVSLREEGNQGLPGHSLLKGPPQGRRGTLPVRPPGGRDREVKRQPAWAQEGAPPCFMALFGGKKSETQRRGGSEKWKPYIWEMVGQGFETTLCVMGLSLRYRGAGWGDCYAKALLPRGVPSVQVPSHINHFPAV